MDKFMEIAGKIGAQKHMVAIRDGFASTLPLVMAGAMALMINNVLFNGDSTVTQLFGKDNPFTAFTSAWISPWLSAFDAGTLSLTALAIAMALAFIRAKQEDVDPLATVLVTTGSYFILGPMLRVSETAPWIAHYFGAMGILVGMLSGLIFPAIFISIVKKGWVIKMPEMVPPAVGRGFAAIIPGAFALGAAALVPYVLTTVIPADVTASILGADYTGPQTIFAFSEKLIQGVLMDIFGGIGEDFLPGLIGASMLKMIMQIFWFFGLHGANLAQPALVPIWGQFDTLNVQAVLEVGSAATLYPWTSTSFAIYVDLGGSGSTLGMLIALALFNKRPDSKAVANIAWGPGMFEINEPVIFGIPMVLNPIYMVPFILIPVVLTVFAYLMTVWGIAGPVVNSIAWTTPPVLGAALATNFNIGAIVTSIMCLVIATLGYIPFVLIANKQYAKKLEEEK